MSQFIQWLPQLVLAAIPGGVNLWLSNVSPPLSIQRSPIFRPIKSPRLWGLRLVQFLIPAILFWWVVPLVFKIPPTAIDRPWSVGLVGSAIAFGWGFRTLLSTPISILSAGMLDIGPIYDFFVHEAYERILLDHGPKLRRFWRDLEDELAQTPQFSDRGIKDLADCLGIYTFLYGVETPSPGSRQALLVERLEALQTSNMSQSEKAADITDLLRTEHAFQTEAAPVETAPVKRSIMPQDWPELIRAFGGREEQLSKLFSTSTVEQQKSKHAPRR